MDEFADCELSTLLNEPLRLSASINELQNQFKGSMARNCDYFLKTCETTSTITDDLEKCSDNIRIVSSDLGRLDSIYEEISNTSKEALEKSRKISDGFKRQTELQTILDIPQFMKTCKISGLYDESIKISQLIEGFSKQNEKIMILHDILEESKDVKRDIADSLIQTFSNNVQLVDMIKNVNIIRQSGVYPEDAIKLSLVRGMRNALAKKCSELIKDNVILYINRVTDLYRTYIFELFTRFSSIFLNDSTESDHILHLAINNGINEYLVLVKKCMSHTHESDDIKAIMEIAQTFSSSLEKVTLSFSELLSERMKKVIENELT